MRSSPVPKFEAIGVLKVRVAVDEDEVVLVI
jgi:hypothetical protein